MQYLDESGNVLYEVNDSDKIFKMVNGKISSLAGAGTRMVVADSSGNLSAGEQIETGTWTPVLRGLTSGVAVAGANNIGKYTKIGKLVMFTACVDWTSITGTITGHRAIAGLPYISSANRPHGTAVCGKMSASSVVCNSNRTLSLLVAQGENFISVGEQDLQTGGDYVTTVTISSSGTLFSVSGSYYTD